MAALDDRELDRLLPPGGALTGRVFARLIGTLSDDPPLEPGTRVGDWRVGKQLGRGGSSMVYLADRADGQFEQQVALKAVRPNQSLTQQFRRERQILAELRHPAIAKLIDGGEIEGGRLWFAMEPVFGERIDRYVRDHRTSLPDRIALFEDVCDAVAYAHSRQLIHRDIKPGNLIVDDAGRPRLLDFGIATSSDIVGVEHDRAMTPTYASPEQRSGDAITTASDVYQLGLLLQLLALPHGEPCETLPQKPSPIIIRELSAIVARATEEDPAHRYPTVAALRADLAAVRQRRPIALIGGWRYPVARFVERNAISSAIAATAIAALLSTGWIAAHRVGIERDQARAASVRATATSDFLIGLFTVPDPGEDRGEELTANDVLARGAAQLRDLSRKDLAQRAIVALDLSRVYMELGEFKRARDVLAPVIDATTSSLPVGATENVQMLNLHGRASYFLGEYDTAAKDFASARHNLVLISDTEQREAEDGNLSTQEAQLSRRLGNLDEAFAQQTRAIDLLRRSHTPDSYQLGLAWNSMGLIARSRGDFATARSAFEQALSIFRSHYGEGHPRTFVPTSNLAEIMVMSKEYALAEPLLLKSIQRYRDLKQGHSNKLSQDLDMLAEVRLGQGRNEEAAALAQESAQGYAELFGPDHNYRAFPLLRLGDARLAMGDGAGALQSYQEALRLRRLAFGDRHRDVARALGKLGVAYERLGNPRAGEAALREAVAISERVLPPRHPMRARVRIGLIATLIELNRIDEAKAQLALVADDLTAAAAGTPTGHASASDQSLPRSRVGKVEGLIALNRFDEAKAELALAANELAMTSDDTAGP